MVKPQTVKLHCNVRTGPGQQTQIPTCRIDKGCEEFVYTEIRNGLGCSSPEEFHVKNLMAVGKS